MEQKCRLNTRPGLHSRLVSLPIPDRPSPSPHWLSWGTCERPRPPQLPCTYLPSSQSLLPPSLRSSRDHSASCLYHQSGNYLAHSRLVKKLLLLLSHFSRVWLCVTPQTAAHQAPPSLGFSRQEQWSGLPFPSPMHESEKWKWSHSVVSDSPQPHGLQPTRLLRPWDFPGKSTGLGCHCLLRKKLLKHL